PLTLTNHNSPTSHLPRENPMWMHTLFKSLTSTPSRRRLIRPRSPASRLLFESLEDRCLLSFSPAVNYPVGLMPQAVVTGDFNNDSLPDLAVLNSYDSPSGESSVSLLL